jgi:uncharacterized membrane protein YoaK (UPF0700 family)
MATPTSLFHSLSDAHATHMLAFVGGFVDAAGYLKLQGVFTSSITGNLVVTCASVSSMAGVICRSTISLSFTLAGGLGAAIALQTRISNILSQGSITIVLFCLEAATLTIVWIIGLHLVTQSFEFHFEFPFLL